MAITQTLTLRLGLRLGLGWNKVISKIQDFLIEITFKDEYLKVLVKTNLLHLVSNFRR